MKDSQSTADPAGLVARLAKGKSSAVVEGLVGKGVEVGVKTVVIGCDTIVVVDGHVMGKPKDEEEAAAFIRKLSGRSHEVMTSICMHILNHDMKIESVKSIVEKTKVFFRPMSEQTILAYVKTGEPMDKAGGYGIQGLAGCFISHIEGDYYNVVGFPLSLFCSALESIDTK
eukprot:TRINITY_DN2412_c0_g1_i1.p1 TRINITY_DN2412_c0_g1~~TRINITY_DN2412_c0_g1_i1.p1  ORF type:complete len:171 (-),score=50.14 TRINITY_DN2412_c0_g1_i1:68-580(-)